jgi:hypothetical protein
MIVASDISHRRSNVKKRITDGAAILKQQCKLPCTEEKYSPRPEFKPLMINIEVSRPLNLYLFMARDLSFRLVLQRVCETWNCHCDFTLCASNAAARNDRHIYVFGSGIRRMTIQVSFGWRKLIYRVSHYLQVHVPLLCNCIGRPCWMVVF